MRASKLLPKQNYSPNAKTAVTSSKKAAAPHFSNGIITPTETQLVSLIHASKNTQQLQQIHTQIIRHSHSSNSWVVTQLISSCSLHKSINYAISIFDHFHNPNLFVFNALIRALADNACFERSISHFVYMLRLSIRPDRLTYPFVLKSSAGLVEGGLGMTVHGEIMKRGLEFDSFVRVSLVDMYVKVELLGFALQLFDESPERNKLGSVLLWNVLINGCCKVGDLGKAVEIFEAMPERNVVSWNCLINGFMRNGEVDRAAEFLFGMLGYTASDGRQTLRINK